MVLMELLSRVLSLVVVLFFQAEDGIRDYKVTGVQTCALPICHPVCGLFCSTEFRHGKTRSFSIRLAAVVADSTTDGHRAGLLFLARRPGHRAVVPGAGYVWLLHRMGGVCQLPAPAG